LANELQLREYGACGDCEEDAVGGEERQLQEELPADIVPQDLKQALAVSEVTLSLSLPLSLSSRSKKTKRYSLCKQSKSYSALYSSYLVTYEPKCALLLKYAVLLLPA
jgi:hypothetical protein